jgi:hypothetical protein
MAADGGEVNGDREREDDREPDPFADLTLDDDFVRGASITEQSAETRIARIARIRSEHDQLATSAEAERRAATRPQRRKRRRTRFVVAAVVVALAGFGYWNFTNGNRSITAVGPQLGGEDAAGTEFRLAGGQPPAGVEASPTPLGRPAVVTQPSSAYRFIATQPGSAAPVAFDPCRAIHLVVNSRTAPPGADQMLTEAVDEVSNATGLRFVFDGPTDEVPTTDRVPYLPDRYPGRWAPVLVGWSDPTESPSLTGEVAGTGGPQYVTTPKGSVSLSGIVTLDGPQFQTILGQPNGYANSRAIIAHELGHLVGLAHVPDPTQLMDAENTGGVTSYQAGDLTGLAELGRGACFPDL